MGESCGHTAVNHVLRPARDPIPENQNTKVASAAGFVEHVGIANHAGAFAIPIPIGRASENGGPDCTGCLFRLCVDTAGTAVHQAVSWREDGSDAVLDQVR